MTEPLECLADTTAHEPHIWDFGSDEKFQCPGVTEETANALRDQVWHETPGDVTYPEPDMEQSTCACGTIAVAICHHNFPPGEAS